MTIVNPTIKIIITDDHKIFRDAVRIGLAIKKDIQVLEEAIHGLDLLNKLEYLRPDIVILGITMPVMNGLETLPVLKSKYPGIKVIMLTMFDDAGTICKAIELGANAYLLKTSDIENIYEAIIACHKNWFFINDTVQNALLRKKKEATDKAGH